MHFVSASLNSRLAVAALGLSLAGWPGGARAVVLGEIARDPDGLRGSVVRIESTSGEMCSGSLIDQDLVLTAAHCVMHKAGYWVVVTDRSFRQRRLRAIAAAMHPDFVAGTTPEDQPGTDLAILKLSERLGPDFQPLSTRGGGGLAAGEAVAIAGYGVVAENRRSTARVLRQARLVSLGDLKVANTVTVVADRRSLAETAGAGACLGDSGGPILKGGPGGYQLVGVVSWSSGAAQQGRVRTACGGFTAVTPIARHTDWIAARIDDFSHYRPGDPAQSRSLRGNPADWTGGR
ncbi:S1 family peptidase [Methylobacterium nodulans]|uniref:Peptidase S1 and S6 chymotrypsin/Hap n=1 Tax=Methylobacterium nodulans (strain LMG 21967 / CNCM I-2342 / ORS 2060) TaxID=460265 RepID=B8IUZ5_METNO|nr:trypsin-like serine protease [Methylobacterium nodulans]ACL59053.1 peptidase S1 and S6 chymotrypsin/Hap [Methylobacterium nodulans ORS 2060]